MAILTDVGVGVGLTIDAEAVEFADADTDVEVVELFTCSEVGPGIRLSVQPEASTAAANNKTVVPHAIRFIICRLFIVVVS